jgi:hypothetical protein
MKRIILSALVVAAGIVVSGTGAPVAAATYGCFRVTVDSLNIRARPYSTAEVIGNAKKGDVLEKRKLLCTPRGFWCAIRKGALEGYADKSLMEKIACP